MTQPVVSVVTPVYNGETYLRECIDSVIAQTYASWEYVIVDNRSTDGTLAIAREYAVRDPRIRVIAATEFVGAIENHHRAFREISPESRYCKVVSADDWIAPECLARLVAIAEAHPTVGIVGSYQWRGDEIQWTGIPGDKEFLTGREAVRLTLLGNVSIFGNPTSNLFRAELVRQKEPFFPHVRPHADTSASYKYLQHWDFGFAHEVLSRERIHEGQVSSRVRDLNMMNLAVLECMLEYGPAYMSREEFETLKAAAFAGYYRSLGGCLLKLKGREFWRYHANGMTALGYRLSWPRILRCALQEMREEMQRPAVALHKLIAAIKQAAARSI